MPMSMPTAPQIANLACYPVEKTLPDPHPIHRRFLVIGCSVTTTGNVWHGICHNCSRRFHTLP